MKVMIAGGGTYGHIAPGLALFHEFQSRGDEVIYLCSKKDMVYKSIQDIKDNVKSIPVRPFKRFDLPAKLSFAFHFLRGCLSSRRIIRKFKPDVLIGVGGYVAGAPFMILRKSKKVKKIILEQNTLPGAVNRYFSRYADLSVLTFEMSKKWMKGKSVVLGNPVLIEKRQDNIALAKDFFKINENDFVLTVMGGSAGAKIVNDTVKEMVPHLKNIKIIWSTGNAHFNDIAAAVKEYDNIRVYPFIDKMDYLLSITDLMISRSGATSIAEICYMGVPAIFIPYKWASENHQVLNANFVVEGGGGEMIEEDHLSAEILLEKTKYLIEHREKLAEMKKKILGLFNADVKKQIVDTIKEVVCSGKN